MAHMWHVPQTVITVTTGTKKPYYSFIPVQRDRYNRNHNTENGNQATNKRFTQSSLKLIWETFIAWYCFLNIGPEIFQQEQQKITTFLPSQYAVDLPYLYPLIHQI